MTFSKSDVKNISPGTYSTFFNIEFIFTLCGISCINCYILLFLIDCTVVLQAVVGHVKLARLNYKRKNCDLSVQLLDEVQAQWSANLHLKLLTLIQEISKFTSDMEGVYRNTKELLLDLELWEDKQKLETLNPILSTHKIQNKKKTLFPICCYT